MIERLKIERFKSIRSLDMECRRINLFIGEPNVGKSNILEALGLLSWCLKPNDSLKDFVRFQLTEHLFFDCLTDEPIRISFQGELKGLELSKTAEEILGRSQHTEKDIAFAIQYENEDFVFKTSDPGLPKIALMDHSGQTKLRGYSKIQQVIKFYRFKTLESYSSPNPSSLIPPYGANLFSVVHGSKVLQEKMVNLFKPYGLMVVRKLQERKFVIQKQQEGMATEFPYEVMSDTLQRVMFYEAAMVSNKDSVLVFEEPEAHAFPYYTKHLGEQLALDETNQYFIATHNPYLLSAVVEKANKNDVGVFITYWENHETKVKMLTGDELSQLMDEDPFLGIERLLSGEGE